MGGGKCRSTPILERLASTLNSIQIGRSGFQSCVMCFVCLGCDDANWTPPRPAETPTPNQRHRDANAAQQLPGQLMGTGHRHETDLAHGLAAAALKGGEALVAREGIPSGCTRCGVTAVHIGRARRRSPGLSCGL